MKLEPIGTFFIDKAWKEGADCLEAACEESGGDITGSQLKMILSRGERTLIRMDNDGKTVGWGAIKVDQLPNLRALHITNLVAPHGHFEQFFEEIKAMAASLGCSEVRCSAKPAQARLYRMKCGFKPVYETLKVEV
ncbi:MAG: hypothetical protein KIT86_00660 [Hydrogenophaga sp.]|uniref:hypothetical protein n=1 Tax=Hydrogenophaga sp. TaxID=1904254 RepID=UPI0026182B25|nr:hypothetical protein [Hydrogenophaga sp.]MCW5668137.1 hypothetical protein [Hydrogenophaga sp.]